MFSTVDESNVFFSWFKTLGMVMCLQISVIIPTRNRASLLKDTLESMIVQTVNPEDFEILIIDNGSTDHTKHVVEEAINAYPCYQIRYIYEPEPGLLSGRHRGALEAKGEILTFIDDDIEADVNWLKAFQESFEDPSVQIIGGRNLPKYEVAPPAWLEWFWLEHPYGRYCPDLSLLDFGDQIRKIDANYVWGLNFSIRKRALLDLGGFHPDCIPKHLQYFQGDGETGLTQKANQYGYTAIYHPKAIVFHRISKKRMTYHYFDQRYFYQGVCNSYSEIRRTHGILRDIRLTARITNVLRTCKRIMKRLAKGRTEEELLKERFSRAYQRGYQFHQNAVRQNPKLLEWVLRKDYWDYILPDLSPTPNLSR